MTRSAASIIRRANVDASGANWIVKPSQVHGIKRDANCAGVKASSVHDTPWILGTQFS
jgi:hypothetical protein